LISLPTLDSERKLGLAGYSCVAGIDEVGRGALAGPVFAAAVVVPFGVDFAWLPLVRDSKQLSPRQRERLFRLIQQDGIPIGLGDAPHSVVDEIGIVGATRLAMCRAVERLPIAPDFLIIDALTLPGVTLPQKGIVRGDETCISIACASVAAKVSRDRYMVEQDALYPGYGMADHKGYGTVGHMVSLRELGPCPIHRRSFAPVQRLIQA
jgi:ribonuclease HII